MEKQVELGREPLDLEEMGTSENQNLRGLYEFIHQKGALFKGVSAFVKQRFGGNYSQAEEVMSNVLEKAYFKSHTYDTSRPLSGWLYTIAQNQCIDYQRHQRVRRKLQNPLKLTVISEETGEENQRDFDPADTYKSPLDCMIEDEEMIKVKRAIEMLPFECRGVFRLIAKDNLMYREIAEELGIPIGTVKSRFHRARQILRKRLQKLKPAA